jgi:hypothetical protein
MIGENRQLVTDEPVEFEKLRVEVQDCRKVTDHFRGSYRIYPNLIKEIRRMSSCNRLDLQTLGSQPIIMRKNFPNHWSSVLQRRSLWSDKIDHELISFMWPSHEGRRVLIQHPRQWTSTWRVSIWRSTSKGWSKIFSKSLKIVQSNSTTFVWDLTVQMTHCTILVHTIFHSLLGVLE